MGEARLAMLVSGTNAGALRGGDLLGHQLCVSCDWRLDMADGTFGYLLIEFGKYSRFVGQSALGNLSRVLDTSRFVSSPSNGRCVGPNTYHPWEYRSKPAFTRSQDHVQHHHYDVKWRGMA